MIGIIEMKIKQAMSAHLKIYFSPNGINWYFLYIYIDLEIPLNMKTRAEERAAPIKPILGIKIILSKITKLIPIVWKIISTL